MRKKSEDELDSRRVRVLEVASHVFLRYGFAKTTLGDIAQEAKVHRPVLYALFPEGKDQLFEAVLLRLVGTEVERYRRAIRDFGTVRQKLLYCVEHWSIGGFQLTETYPDARDAFNMAYPAVRKMYEVLTAFYAELLGEAVSTSELGYSAEELARLLIFCLRGIKDMAEDADGLRQLLALEVDLFLRALKA